MKLPKNFDKLVQEFGKVPAACQNYIEFDEKLLKFRPYGSSQFEPWWGVGGSYREDGLHIEVLNTRRVCAASLDNDYKDRKVHHVLHLLGKRSDKETSNNFFEAILKLNEGRFIRTSDNTVLLHNINDYNQNDFGRFVVSLRAPTELPSTYKTFNYLREYGVPEIVAVHLAFIFDLTRDTPNLQPSHQAFNARGEISLDKLFKFIASGKNLWANNWDPDPGMYSRWQLMAHDQKHFKGNPWKGITPYKTTKLYGDEVKEYKNKSVLEHIIKLTQEYGIEQS